MERNEMTHIEREREWKDRIVNYQASGLSMKAWSKRNGVSRGTLSNWVKKLSTQDQSPINKPTNFVLAKPAAVTIETINPEAEITIRIGKAIINIKDGFNCDTLTSVLIAVNAIC